MISRTSNRRRRSKENKNNKSRKHFFSFSIQTSIQII